ncbi:MULTISPECIES: hypothetical protein [Halobacteriales]|uniref:SPW repeat-containing protein n=1 Tax=Halohasta litorea TaxID=869891 RepID=A0ABD6DE12_9EURY|nr:MULTISPECIES: hypothetical protein [Halobacteria]
MHTEDEVEFGGIWEGLSTILVSVLAVGVFVIASDPINIGGVVASVALAALGVAQLIAPRVLPWYTSLSPRWTGLFWILVGIGLAVLGVVSSTTIGRFGGGVLLGGLFVLYGFLTALDR